MYQWFNRTVVFGIGSPTRITVQAIAASDGEPDKPAVVRKSRLSQGHERIYGDNSVIHYKMEIEPDQEIVSTVPQLTLEYSETRQRRVNWKGWWYTDEEYRYYTSGVNYQYYYQANRRIWDLRPKDDYSNVTITEYRQVPLPDKRFWYEWYERRGNYYAKGTHVDPVPEMGEWRRVSTNSISSMQVVSEIVWNRVSPPYYWIEHANSVFAAVAEPGDPGALSECIRNTIQEFTTYDTNGYQNILEFLSLLKNARDLSVSDLLKDSQKIWKDLLIAVGKEIPDDPALAKKVARQALRKRAVKGAGSAWLKYRYAYNTAKADYEQYVRAKVGEYLGKLDQHRVLRGQIDIGGGTLRVKMRLTDNTRANFDKFLISGNQYGLYPGLYNLWDMIPFSFIADWFSNLGDELQDIDQSIFFRYYEVNELLVTRKKTVVKDELWGKTTYKFYQRELLDRMPQWEIYEDPKGPSGRTIAKRCLDGVSIVSGFC